MYSKIKEIFVAFHDVHMSFHQAKNSYFWRVSLIEALVLPGMRYPVLSSWRQAWHLGADMNVFRSSGLWHLRQVQSKCHFFFRAFLRHNLHSSQSKYLKIKVNFWFLNHSFFLHRKLLLFFSDQNFQTSIIKTSKV